MTEATHNINWVTFLLAWVAGFCDTATFVSGDSIFSAHVTGNFIVFAAQIAAGGDNMDSWIKLVTFPVFVLAVMAGGWVVEKTQRKYKILLAEGIILVICGIGAILLPMLTGGEEKIMTYSIVMTTVAAMGLQNAFGKLFAKETHGPTTMMTGNVTQASLDLGSLIRKGRSGDALAWKDFQGQLFTIGGFLAGCVIGAIMAKWLGLSAILLPGVAIVVCYLQGEAMARKFEQ
ncbi:MULTISPECIES: YoaK family protein [unclassified Chitinophaga]|uniref:YoaK family protein n=1 Tax=unclassified Chitinophaga TaxID=2619133 RepID=UPI00300FA141